MKKIKKIIGFLFIPWMCLAQSWPPYEVKGNAGKEINAVYAPFDQISHVTPCLQATNVDTSTQTSVNSDSASGQTTVNIASSTNLAQGDVVVIGAGTAREEVCTIASVGAGPTIICNSNLGFTHTAAQADKVDKTNVVGPLNVAQMYMFYCHDGAGTQRPCACLMGPQYVDPIKYIPVQFFAADKYMFFTMASYNYISCYAYSNNTILDVCATHY